MIVGIDPGKSGAIVGIGEHSFAERMPVIGKEIDGASIARILRDTQPEVVIVEKVGAMPKQGVSSTFSFGKGFGIVIGILEALGIPYRLVTPQAWKKKVLAGTSKDKDAAINFVRRAYPDIQIVPPKCRVAHDGIADAACMADYGRQILVQEAVA